MRLGKVRAVINWDGIDVYLLNNGRAVRYLGLLWDLSRIDTWAGQFHLRTKSGNCLWVDEIQKGISPPEGGLEH